MSDSPRNTETEDEGVSLAEVFRPIAGRGAWIRKITLVAGLLALLGGIFYLVLQPAVRVASLQFVPTFDRADKGEYPNGLPFSSADIVSPLILSQVYAANQIGEFCAEDRFAAGFVVLESSPELQFLRQEVDARLSDARLTVIERQRIQEEYVERRETLHPRYALQFIQPRDCKAIPEPLVLKAMTEVLQGWATDAVQRRGVMRLRVSILSPAIFDQADTRPENELIRADLLRQAVARVISNISAVEALPGAQLIRGSDRNVSFAEVRAELEDLQASRLGPVIALAGRGLGEQASRWAQQALQTATNRQRVVQGRAEAYARALREYSGVPTAARQPDRAAGGSPATSDVQSLTPEIDSTFIDRIVQLSASNTAFRQEITRQAIAASVEAVELSAVVEQYRQLIAWLGDPPPAGTEPVAAMLARFSTQAREATKRFNEIYEEFSKRATSASAVMYRIEAPPHLEIIRTFDFRRLMLFVVFVLLVVPVLLIIVILARYHSRQLLLKMR